MGATRFIVALTINTNRIVSYNAAVVALTECVELHRDDLCWAERCRRLVGVLVRRAGDWNTWHCKC